MRKIFCLILALMLMTGCIGESYVVKIGSDKINRGEYLVYLMEQKKNFEEQGGTDIWGADFEGVSAEEIAKQNAVNTLVMVKTAEELMAEFESEDLTALDLNIDKIRSIMEEVMLQQKVYNYVTDSYTVNEAEFGEYLNKYYSEHKSDFTDYMIKEIFIQPDIDGDANKKLAQSAYSRISAGTPFDTVLKEISPQSSAEPGKLDASLYTENTLRQIYNHNKGDCFLVEDTDGSHIFYISDVVSSPLESIEPQIREEYINEKKQEIYTNQSNIWQGDMVVEKNDEQWNNINIVKE